MSRQAQLSDRISSKDLPLSSLYRYKMQGSAVIFGGVDHHYYKGELSWVPVPTSPLADKHEPVSLSL